MRTLIHPATAAFGLANLYLLSLTGPLISSGHDLVYHLTGPAAVIFIPVTVYVLGLWALLTVLLVLAERPGRLRVIIWTAAVFALPWILVETFTGFFESKVPGWISLLIVMVSLVAFAIAVGWRRMQPVFETAQSVAETVLEFAAFFGVIILCQLLWFGWQARHLNSRPVLHASQSAAALPRQRVIWILLDELSYQQTYEQRFPGLQLPAFDQLAAQSVVFTHVVPAGEYTREVIPSLLTGIPADKLSISGAGLLSAMHDTTTGKWVRFDQRKTVFQDAMNAGYRTGIAGWYNPYCRILPSVLDRCYWTYLTDLPGGLTASATLKHNLAAPLRQVAQNVRQTVGDGPSDEQIEIRMHSRDYTELMNAGDALLNDRSIRFVLIHMPVPHPLGFYDRKNHRLAEGGSSYIDNLALADEYLEHVRELLERENQWDSAAVVVMGDHSWRTSLIWANSPGWTAEDQAASRGGRFDERPAFIVKLPYQQIAARVDVAFQAIRTRALFDAMMYGQLRTPEQLQQWVLQH